MVKPAIIDNTHHCGLCETPYDTEDEALECCQCEDCIELQRKHDAVMKYIDNLDGLPGSPLWRIKEDIRALLEVDDD